MKLRIPPEWEPHARCWMPWVVQAEWLDWEDAVKDELATAHQDHLAVRAGALADTSTKT